MNFSYEELYSMYGQYDKFITLEFHFKSESYSIFGKSIMGTFKYDQEERDCLEEILKSKCIPRSTKKVKFSPSLLHNLTDEQNTILDRDGILCSDINLILSFNSPVNNLYSHTGKKTLPDKIPIKISMSEKEGTELMFGLYKSKMSSGYELTYFEKDEYYGMLAYFHSNKLADNEKEMIFIKDSDEMSPSIRENFLATKWKIEGINEDEKQEINSLWKNKIDFNREILQKEVQRADVKWGTIPLDKLMKLLAVAGSFKEEILLIGKKPIWWEIERFLHIVIRHASDLQIGKYENKTEFQYKYQNIKELIKNVLNSVEKDIENEFKQNPNRNYNRRGKRAVYYNGNYYRIEIEVSGKLLTFHPYNDDKEREKDD